MPFITDPDLDRFMGRHAPGGGAFAAFLCLAQLAPDAPAPLEVVIQALNAWLDEQHDDLMTLLEGLEERDRILITKHRAGTTITVSPALLAEVERQLAAIPDDQHRMALLTGVRVDVDTALTELVFDVSDPAPAPKEAWCRMFIPHFLHRVGDNLALLPSLASVIARYEPARFGTMAELIPTYLDTLPTFDTNDSEVMEDDPDDTNARRAFVAMYTEMVLQDACLAVEGVTDALLRRRIHAAARGVVEYIERHHLERSLTGRLHYASLPETPLDEAQNLLRALFDRVGGPRIDPYHASRAHRVAATWLRRLRHDAPADPMIKQLIPLVTVLTFDDLMFEDGDPEFALSVAACHVVQATLAIEAGEVERAMTLLTATIDVIQEDANIGMFDDDTEFADRLIADMACMQARLALRQGNIPQAHQYYTTAIGSLRREHGRQHHLVQQVDTERRRLGGKRVRKP